MSGHNTGERSTPGISRRGYLRLGAGASAVAVAGCLGDEDQGTITYLNRGGVIEEAEREVIERWEEESGVSVEFQAAAEDTEMFEMISESPEQFDMATFSPYGYALHEVAYEAALLEPLDYDQLPNYTDNIQEEWRNADFLEGHDFGAFYHVSTQGIGYNTDEIDEISSWEDITDPDLDGTVTLFDSAPTRFGNAAAAIGVNPAEAVTDDELFEDVFDEIAAQHENVYSYWQAGNEFMQELREGQAHAASAWGGRVQALAEEGHPVDYAVPEEGAITWSVAFSIVEESEVKEEVYDLINWLYQEDVATEMVEQHYYPVPLKADHEELEGLFESTEADEVQWFDWAQVIPHLEDIEQRFAEVKAG